MRLLFLAETRCVMFSLHQVADVTPALVDISSDQLQAALLKAMRDWLASDRGEHAA